MDLSMPFLQMYQEMVQSWPIRRKEPLPCMIYVRTHIHTCLSYSWETLTRSVQSVDQLTQRAACVDSQTQTGQHIGAHSLYIMHVTKLHIHRVCMLVHLCIIYYEAILKLYLFVSTSPFIQNDHMHGFHWLLFCVVVGFAQFQHFSKAHKSNLR